MHVDLQIACTNTGIPSEDLFSQWVKAALLPGQEAADICIRLVSREESQALNHQYRGKNKPTNVLSFEYEEDDFAVDEEFDNTHLGDLAICADLVAEEAQQQEKTELAHWAHLTVHGTLHLQGLDHQNDKEAEHMEQLEINILAELGFSNPYDVKGPDNV